MKTMAMSILLIMITSLNAQNRYPLPSKKTNFSQWDWLEIMSDLANDSNILQNMKHNSRGTIPIINKSYVCNINDEHPIVLQFCPECVWVIDSCISNCNVGIVSITAGGGYGFHVGTIGTQDIWNAGDTVASLTYMLHVPKSEEGATKKICFLVPVISNMVIPAYSIYPSKNKKTAK